VIRVIRVICEICGFKLSKRKNIMNAVRKRFYLQLWVCIVAALALIPFFGAPPAAGAKIGFNPGCDTVNAIFISDRITDVAYRLGATPVAYCARCCWPMTQKELSTVTRLGCYRCATIDSVIKTADKHKVSLILIEDGLVSIHKDWNWKDKYLRPLKKRGYDVHVISFSKGTPQAILETGKLLHREEKAGRLAAKYARKHRQTMTAISAFRANKKILILQGLGRRGVRVEAPGGYSDKFLLEPLGCVNVGDLARKQDTKVNKGYFLLEDWQAVSNANPDIIVKYGNPCAVEKSLARALKRYPELTKVTAIRDHAIYTLPFYMNSSVTQYPKILKVWFDAVYKK